MVWSVCHQEQHDSLSFRHFHSNASSLSLLKTKLYVLFKAHHPLSTVPLSLSLCRGVRKKLQTPCAQMTKLSKGESRDWICFPTVCPVVWPFVLFFGPLTFCSAALGTRSHSQPALDLKHNIGSSYYPRLVNNPVRKYYLIMNGHVCLLNVTVTRGICCSKAVFVCSEIILYFPNGMECVDRSPLQCSILIKVM